MKKSVIGLCAVFAAAALVFVLQLTLALGAKTLPGGIGIYARRGMDIRFADCDNAGMEAVASGIVTEVASAASAFSGVDTPVRLMYTNQSFSEIVPLRFRYGAYFTQNPVQEANGAVVISQALAFRLFQVYDAVGKSLTIGGRDYAVCGVYEEADIFFTGLSSDGLERVFLSYANLEDYNQAQIQQLYLRGEAGQLAGGLVAKAQLPHNPPIRYDSLTNFEDVGRLVEQGVKIPIFLLGINVMAFLAYLLVKRLLCAYGLVRQGAGKGQILVQGLLSLACLGGAVLLWQLVAFTPYIPPGALPADNLFDFGFYLNHITSIVQSHNLLQLYDYYWNYSAVLLTASALCAAVLTALLLCLWWGAVRAIRCHLKCCLNCA